MKRMLMLASVASMIDQFNMPNIELLQDMGYAVDVACNFREGNTCSDEEVKDLESRLAKMNVRCYQIDFARDVTVLAKNMKALWQVEHLLKKNHYQFLHCHSPIGGVVGRIAGKKTGTKVIYTAHGFHFYKGAPKKNWLIYYPIEKMCARYTDVLITINQEDYEIAKNRMSARRVEKIPGVGIDLSRFINCEVDKNAVRDKFGISPEEKVLIYVAELNVNKNQSSLLQMLAELRKIRTDVNLLLVGKGDNEVNLKNQCKQLQLENNVIFAGYRSDVPDLLKASDIAVPSSIREGFGLNIIEAMACKVPVVAYDNRGHRTIIRDGENGYLVPNGDYKAMAEKVCLLLDDEETANKIKRTAFLELHKYSSEYVTEMMHKIYDINDL